MRASIRAAGLLLSLFCVLCFLPDARAQSNFMVVRVGDGVGHPSGIAVPVFIEERQSDGSLVRTLALPTAASGENPPMTLTAATASEGALTRSVDGLYVTLAGYGAVPGTVMVATTGSDVVNRVVARIDAAGTIDVSTRINAAFDNGMPRSAVTEDGSSFWVSGTGTPSGIQYVTHGTTSAGTQISNLAAPRVLGIFNGQLYGTASSTPRLYSVGTGLPTASGQTITVLPGTLTTIGSPYAFAIGPPGVPVFYTADDGTGAGCVQKWIFDGVTWTHAYTLNNGTPGSPGCRGLCVDWSGVQPRIYATTDPTVANQLLVFVDAGSGSLPVVLATAPMSTVYRGVALAPSINALATPGLADEMGPSSVSCEPNPFAGRTTLRCSLSKSERVRLEVFDALGRRVTTLVDGEAPAGRLSVTFEANGLADGIYFYRLRAGRLDTTGKMLRLSTTP